MVGLVLAGVGVIMAKATSGTAWIVALLLALLCVVLLAAMVSVNAADVQQMATDLGITEQILAKVRSILDLYGWSLGASLVSPLLTYRAVNWIKMVSASVKGRKPHWILMDILSFIMVFALSLACLYIDNPIWLSGLVIAFFIAGLNSCVIKLIFNFAPEKVVAAFTDGVYVDEKTSLGGKTVAALVGKRGDLRVDARDSEDKTEPKV